MRTPTSEMPQHVYDLRRDGTEWGWDLYKYDKEPCPNVLALIREFRREENKLKGRPRFWYRPSEARELSRELLISRLASGWLRTPIPQELKRKKIMMPNAWEDSQDSVDTLEIIEELDLAKNSLKRCSDISSFIKAYLEFEKVINMCCLGELQSLRHHMPENIWHREIVCGMYDCRRELDRGFAKFRKKLRREDFYDVLLVSNLAYKYYREFYENA